MTDDKNRWNEYAKAVPFVGKYLESKDKVAVLRMAGVIADTSMIRKAGISHHKFRAAIDDAFSLSRLKAVALIINSPGGAPAQCSLISAQIMRLSSEKDVPVFAFVEDVAASGGYWLACIGHEIYVQESSIAGSIGVISSGFGFEDFIRKHEIRRRVHASGRDKSFLDPFQPEKADDVARLKKLQAEIHQSFKEWVAERRGGKLHGTEAELMEGAFWTGREAITRGLADGIGECEAVMKEKFGEDIRFVDCTPEKKGLLSALIPFGGADAMFDPSALIETAEERAAWGRFGL